MNKAKLTCVDGDSEPPSRQANHNNHSDAPLQRQGSNRRGGRSKSRSKKPPQDNKRVDKTAKALGIEINSTLDRISELDAQNELLMLENQKLKDEIVEMQGKQKGTQKHIDSLDEKIRHMDRIQQEGDKNLSEVREEGMMKDAEIEKYAKQAKRLADLNEELREPFEEERNAMTEE